MRSAAVDADGLVVGGASSSREPVEVGRAHAPQVHEEPDDDRDPGLERDPPTEAADRQEEQERVEVLGVAEPELQSARVGVQQDRGMRMSPTDAQAPMPEPVGPARLDRPQEERRRQEDGQPAQPARLDPRELADLDRARSGTGHELARDVDDARRSRRGTGIHRAGPGSRHSRYSNSVPNQDHVGGLPMSGIPHTGGQGPG